MGNLLKSSENRIRKNLAVECHVGYWPKAEEAALSAYRRTPDMISWPVAKRLVDPVDVYFFCKADRIFNLGGITKRSGSKSVGPNAMNFIAGLQSLPTQ
jgi:hypothetical protein